MAKLRLSGYSVKVHDSRTARQDTRTRRADPGKTTTERGYGWKWQQERERHLKANPLCVFCEERGVITAANTVDHKIPHKGDERLFWDRENWQSLCASCHSSHKQRQERQQGFHAR